ncbi:MAG TPA: FAD-dependent oxidoreductase [Solirubrobacterales bacterium]|jgi:NADPH-dependent 2,4-dienoyl-CoA reductase/sulfur reductase-like enzyme
MHPEGVVIVGGGLAAQRCAETLRRRGYDGSVRIVCAESDPPYDRPPLSKQVLAGEAAAEEVAYRPAWWYEEKRVELLLGVRAVGLDPEAKLLALDQGGELAFEQLVIATGGRARHLPFLEGFENVHYLRGLADAGRLRGEMQAGGRLAVVGAGFIGQEVAATARRLGLEVTMVEALAAPLAPILGERLGGWFAELHREEGVRLFTGARLREARGRGRVEELALEDGTVVACDAVVVGVGTAPATGWLAGSGLPAEAVRTDTAGRSAIRDVFAAGDACQAFDPRYGEYARTEHWDAAAWQGAAVAQAILGEYPGTPPLPSFWSDQYGLRIQCVGHARRADAVLFEGKPESRDFEAIFTRSGRAVAGLAVGRPRAIPALRRRIDAERWPGSDRNEEAA